MSSKNSCHKFCEYFAFVFKSNINNIINFLPRYYIQPNFFIFTIILPTIDIYLNFDDILKVIHDINNTRSHGPDDFLFFNKKNLRSLA